MSLKRSLTESPDAAVRKTAQENSNRAWAEVEDVCAACLNAIAGTRLTLYKRRNIPHFLQPPLFEAAISQKTLAAMLAAIRTTFEVPREYLRLKTRLIGRDKLGIQDLYCPLPLKEDQRVGWAQAGQWLDQAYSKSYPAFADFCRHALSQRWVDYQSREGKRPGGFCTSPITDGESRVFMTFNETMGDVQTLAHEFGHAYHNWVMRKERPLNLIYPMTLAETASTFAETLLTDAMIGSPETSPSLKLSLLATRLDNAVAFLLNIPSRFDFERQFYEERGRGEVSVSRIKEIMLEKQRECYADIIDPEEEDAYFWASKLHFYITEISFYNFPYSFGYLFSLGVYAQAQKEGPDFYPRYEELLRRTGSDTAENIARQSLGVDLENPQFWLDSIAIVERDLAAFRTQAKVIFPNV
jgi:oligoendopeptidase F